MCSACLSPLCLSHLLLSLWHPLDLGLFHEVKCARISQPLRASGEPMARGFSDTCMFSEKPTIVFDLRLACLP